MVLPVQDCELSHPPLATNGASPFLPLPQWHMYLVAGILKVGHRHGTGIEVPLVLSSRPVAHLAPCVPNGRTGRCISRNSSEQLLACA